MTDHDDQGDSSANRKPFKDGNVDENGDYIIGKNRPPPNGRFQHNDNRLRGRRPKGVRNFQTEWDEVANERVTLIENGRKTRPTKRKAAIKRLHDDAIKGKSAGQRTYFDQVNRQKPKAIVEALVLSPVEESILSDLERLLEAGFPEPEVTGDALDDDARVNGGSDADDADDNQKA